MVAMNVVAETRRRLLADVRVQERLDDLAALLDRIESPVCECADDPPEPVAPVWPRSANLHLISGAGRRVACDRCRDAWGAAVERFEELIDAMAAATDQVLDRAAIEAVLNGYEHEPLSFRQRHDGRLLVFSASPPLSWPQEPQPARRLRGESAETVQLVADALAAHVAGDSRFPDYDAATDHNKAPATVRSARERIRRRVTQLEMP